MQVQKVVLIAIVALFGCAPKKPVKASIPEPCIDKLLIDRPDATCTPKSDGTFRCKDFTVVAHCWKVN